MDFRIAVPLERAEEFKATLFDFLEGLTQAGLDGFAATEQFFHRALKNPGQSQGRGHRGRESFALDGANRRARYSGAFRQFRLRPFARAPPRLHRIG